MRRKRSSSYPDVLIDRCASPQLARPLLRLFQVEALTLAEVFGKGYAQTMSDIEWIEYCGANGVVALTANEHIWKVPHEVESILKHDAAVITMKAQLTRLESAFVVGRNIMTVRRLMDQGGASFTQITAGRPTVRPLRL